jgi:hypothetical protein
VTLITVYGVVALSFHLPDDLDIQARPPPFGLY